MAVVSRCRGNLALVITLNVLFLTTAMYSSGQSGCFFLGGVVYAWTIGLLVYRQSSPAPDTHASGHKGYVSGGAHKSRREGKTHPQLQAQSGHSRKGGAGPCASKCPLKQPAIEQARPALPRRRRPWKVFSLLSGTNLHTLREHLREHPLRRKLEGCVGTVWAEAHLQAAAIVIKRRMKNEGKLTLSKVRQLPREW